MRYCWGRAEVRNSRWEMETTGNQAACTVTFVLLRVYTANYWLTLLFWFFIHYGYHWEPPAYIVTCVVPRVFIDKQERGRSVVVVGINIPTFKSKTVCAAQICLNQVSISAATIHCLFRTFPHRINLLARNCVKCSLFSGCSHWKIQKYRNGIPAWVTQLLLARP